MKKIQKGFTLIELLIVIAIIGILAGVILVSTNNARNRAANNAIRSSMVSIKNGIANCCFGAAEGTLQAKAAGTLPATAMCAPNTGSMYPTSLQLTGTTSVAYVVNNNCNTATPTITATIVGGLCAGDFTITASGLTAEPGGSCI
jgi:prepilin-type N-terminal cleavage/methylation domain-containing protein